MDPVDHGHASGVPVVEEETIRRLGARKHPHCNVAVHGQADPCARADPAEDQAWRYPAEGLVDLVAERERRVVGLVNVDLGLAHRAEDLLALALQLRDPLDHAVLVAFEGAGARVDPGGLGGAGLVLVHKADKAAALAILRPGLK